MIKNQWHVFCFVFLITDEGINQESLYCLNDQEIDSLIPKLGPRAKFKRRLESLKVKSFTVKIIHIKSVSVS